MAETSYIRNVSDFPNGIVDPSHLRNEIDAELDITIKTSQLPDVRFDGSVLIYFADSLSSAEVTSLDAIIAQHTGEPIIDEAVTADGRLLVVSEPRSDISTPTIITPDWTDPTTWYYSSERVLNETLIDSGDQKTFSSSNTNWIDLTDGAVTQGHAIWPTYQYDIRVNGVAKTPNSRGALDGDFSVDPKTGSVTFNTALNGSDTVEADYSYMKDSVWALVPDDGKKLALRSVEVQFSTDVILTTTAIFSVYGFVEAFAPSLAVSGGGTIPDGTKIKIKENRYERMANYIDEAQHAYPNIPALGGAGWRGMQNPMHVFRWPYTDNFGGPVMLTSSKGMELRISLENDIPFDGERAVVSLYASSCQDG